MRIKKIPTKHFLILALSLCVISACHEYDNFTTYYNTYYNAERLIEEAEDEFEYQDEKKRVDPRTIVPDPKIRFDAPSLPGLPPFIAPMVIDQQKLQPVQTKIDSVIIKCSKILAKHPKSDFVDKSLYLIAKAYFYRREWLPAETKCSELIDKFPESDLLPDAHLLMAKNMLIEQKTHAGKIMLSRTIDVAWAKKRYDILSEAFKVRAELALYENDPDEAVKTYRQAVAQSENSTMKAVWQNDLGIILYRVSRFADAAEAFKKVQNYSPDYVTEFEAHMYRAECLTRLGRYADADKIITSLEDDRTNESWKPWLHAVRMDMARFQKKDTLFQKLEKTADSAYGSFAPIQSVYFECGIEQFYKPDFVMARKYLSRTRTLRTTVAPTADKMYLLLSRFEEKNQIAKPVKQKMKTKEVVSDSSRFECASALFEMGRVLEQLSMPDSAKYYYKDACEISPSGNPGTARFVYAYSRIMQKNDPAMSDSLLYVLAEKYPKTEFGRDAMIRQGFTPQYMIDSAAEAFYSGLSLIKIKEYGFGLERLRSVYSNFPKNPYAPKSLYNAGWHFEKTIRNVDSALYYYKLLLKSYPDNDYAKDVRISVEYLTAVREGRPYVDSVALRQAAARDSLAKADSLSAALKKKQLAEEEMLKKTQKKMPQKPGGTAKTDKKGLSPGDFMKEAGDKLDKLKHISDDPASLLDKAKDAVKDAANDTNTVNIKPGFKSNIPTSLDEWMGKKDSVNKRSPQDTSGNQNPKPKTPDPNTPPPPDGKKDSSSNDSIIRHKEFINDRLMQDSRA